MPYLKFSVTFLNGTFHGRADNGVPEWPPAPLRVFQALVASAGARWGSPLPNDVAAAFDWLADQPPPVITAPPRHSGIPYQTSVPNNAMDIVARAWSKGNDSSKDAQPSTHKAMKTIRPTYLRAENDNESRVDYFWTICDSPETASQRHIKILIDLAPRLVAVGWGLDLVAGHAEVVAEEDADDIQRERWNPGPDGSPAIRRPNRATRRHLENRHQMFIQRLTRGTLTPVPALPPAAYEAVGYHRAWEPSQLSVAAFSLLKTDGSGFRAFRETKGCEVAGMLRHATGRAAGTAGWSDDRIGKFILGHAESEQEHHQPVGRRRFAYIPLPSLEYRGTGNEADHVSMIRRALLYVPTNGHDEQIAWARRALSGCELIREQSGEPQCLLSMLPDSDKMIQRYVPRRKNVLGAETWATVTPVILPGRDDRRDKKTEALLRKAIVQAGYSETLAHHAALDWRKVGFWPGAEHAERYFAPKYLQGYPAYHVKITWRDPLGQPVAIPGPIIVGGGRYSGLGLFAALNQ